MVVLLVLVLVVVCSQHLEIAEAERERAVLLWLCVHFAAGRGAPPCVLLRVLFCVWALLIPTPRLPTPPACKPQRSSVPANRLTFDAQLRRFSSVLLTLLLPRCCCC